MWVRLLLVLAIVVLGVCDAAADENFARAFARSNKFNPVKQGLDPPGKPRIEQQQPHLAPRPNAVAQGSSGLSTEDQLKLKRMVRARARRMRQSARQQAINAHNAAAWNANIAFAMRQMGR